ncbi:MAG TPA: acetoacetate--CoA ligase [Ramlibacter sp.]|nr:acetoacetate--CoA ligase [Ramlibacter sp.]
MTLSDAAPAPAHAGQARQPVFTPLPEAIAASQMTAFTRALEAHTGREFGSYQQLHDFSVREYRTFWEFFARWAQARLVFSGSDAPVCIGDDCEHARFFPALRLNYADSLLNSSVPADAPALTACHADGSRVRWTRGELRQRVARLAQGLSSLGLGEGDRVVCVMRNDEAAIVVALAVTALGATLSTAAPEMGVEAIVDRFAPLAPRFLFAHVASRPFDLGAPLPENVADVAAALPSLQAVIRLDEGMLPARVTQPSVGLRELPENADPAAFVWRRFAFNHPLFIMFSSGTTGKPKCIVHGAGGTLLEQVKEHQLHTDLRLGDRMYFHTNCAWMMWNWQLSSLASGVEIVTYDGPISSVDKLWRLVAQERVTVFGTSPAYLRMCQDAGLAPGRELDLGPLRAMLSTGSVLYDEQFHWVREQVKALPLQSISGGTDILGCFVLGNPNLPVMAGEAQCKSLGLDVQAWSEGKPGAGVGQLVCAAPFPSRPLGFFADAGGRGFHAAYFSQNPGCWTHGDLIEFSREGTARLHGRSDGVLNVRGIKITPGEIYRLLQRFPQIHESMLVEQRPREVAPHQPQAPRVEQQLVLLLVLRSGLTLDNNLVAEVRRELGRRLSAAHVPDRIIAVAELPVTHNGKLSEAAARNAVNGLPIDNASALRNPGCLDAIRNHPGLRPPKLALPLVRPPRGQLGPLLQQQWEQRFGFAPIGLDDNFFELGGNSLLAARLLADVQQVTGRMLPLATLLAAPTIRRLAQFIEDGEPLPESPTLVPMRSGSGAPLFLVHGLSGSVLECHTVVAALQTQRPVIGLQAQGLDGEELPPDRIEDIAAHYVRQIRAAHPTGPYALAGYSFGGLVALEIAQQLRRAGQSIELLCLLDTYVHQDLALGPRLRHHCARAQRKLRELTTRQLAGYAAAKFAEAAGRIRTRARPARSRQAALDSAIAPAWQTVYDRMCAAMAAYRPQPYEGGRMVHVRAAVELGGDYIDPMPLWRQIARGGIVVFDVPGHHLEMVASNAKAVAAALDQVLGPGAAPVAELEKRTRSL